MAEARSVPLTLWSVMALLAAALFGERLMTQWPTEAAGEIGRVIFTHSILPRAAVALLAGAALGLSGLLLQRILRNPLAEPSTLGISAGAQLAMAAATLYAPWAMQASVGLVAFLGGIAAVALILSLTWRRGLEPVSVVLAGMMVALTANAASAALILANGEYLFSLFIWGGGSLTQQSWEPSVTIATRLAIGIAAAFLMARPLSILSLDDGSARSLGVAPHLSRFAVIAVAVWIATTVAAEVGIIGFVGLAAPALASLSGARTLKQRLVAAPLIGAILLWLTDGLVQLAAGPGGERVPTGAATALLGGPLLLWLLPRLRLLEWPSLAQPITTTRRIGRPALLVAVIVLATLAAAALALLLGRGPDGWALARGDLLADLMQWRAPRLVVATAAGAMLGAAGVAIQRVAGNPLASPEVLGVGAGAGAGLAFVFIAGLAGTAWQLAGAGAGATTVLVLILAIGARGQFGPERLLLAGIAMNALCGAVLTAIIALGNMQSYALLRWLSGSTADASPQQAWMMLAVAAAFGGAMLLASRWLDILPLGDPTARALGVQVKTARLVLVFIAALLSAFAAMFVGPLSFIGLIAPHLARLFGLSRAGWQLLGAMAFGALLMILSDWLSRMVAFPYQLPVGLFASILGGPYLIYLLGKGVPRHG